MGFYIAWKNKLECDDGDQDFTQDGTHELFKEGKQYVVEESKGTSIQ